MTLVDLTFPVFLVAVTLIYFLMPRRARWVVLLVASYLFFWLNSHGLLLVHVASMLVTYTTARIIDAINNQAERTLEGGHFSRQERKAAKAAAKRKARPALITGTLLVLGTLLYLKYSNFFLESLASALPSILPTVPHLNLLLPIGISFYTLQEIAYMTDVYRGKYQAERNVAKFALYLSFFPQIIQGPIPQYQRLAPQLYEGTSFDYTRLCHGLQLMLWGWIQKLVIADRIAVPVNMVFDDPTSYHGLIVFLAAAGYGLQVYADFSGGMDIARGFSQILGIELDLNFRQPYFSKSIEEFWRRWHISLGQWMKNYVFYPLSLSKVFVWLGRKSRSLLGSFAGKRLPPILAMFIVYLLVGFWHGPQWKYVAYGIWNGIFIVGGILLPEVYEKACSLARIDRESFGWRAFQVVRTFAICTLGRLFSRGRSLRAALAMFASIGSGWQDLSFLIDGTFAEMGLDTANWILLFSFIGVMLLVDTLHERGSHIREAIDRQHVVLRWTLYLVAIVSLVVFGMYGPDVATASFIYEQF